MQIFHLNAKPNSQGPIEELVQLSDTAGFYVNKYLKKQNFLEIYAELY